MLMAIAHNLNILYRLLEVIRLIRFLLASYAKVLYDSNNFKDQKPFHHYDENWDQTPFSLIVCPVMQAKKSATACFAE